MKAVFTLNPSRLIGLFKIFKGACASVRQLKQSHQPHSLYYLASMMLSSLLKVSNACDTYCMEVYFLQDSGYIIVHLLCVLLSALSKSPSGEIPTLNFPKLYCRVVNYYRKSRNFWVYLRTALSYFSMFQDN